MRRSCHRRRDYRRHASLLAVLLLHTGALYAVAHDADHVLASTSVPITVSFISPLDATQPKKPVSRPKSPVVERKLAKTKIAAPLPEPEPVQTPAAREQPAPPEVVPPKFDAAYLNNPVPAYPSVSRKLGEHGRVMLRVYVNADGSARDVQVAVSCGHPRLDHAAKQAVERWRFAPARHGDRAVGGWALVPINFTLSQG